MAQHIAADDDSNLAIAIEEHYAGLVVPGTGYDGNIGDMPMVALPLARLAAYGNLAESLFKLRPVDNVYMAEYLDMIANIICHYSQYDPLFDIVQFMDWAGIGKRGDGILYPLPF